MIGYSIYIKIFTHYYVININVIPGARLSFVNSYAAQALRIILGCGWPTCQRKQSPASIPRKLPCKLEKHAFSLIFRHFSIKLFYLFLVLRFL
jgi:hypothetical protein